MLVFHREIKTTVQEEPEQWVVNAYLSDITHEIRVTLKVDYSLQITAVAADMIRVPYEVCTKAQDKLNHLVGLKIESGISRRVSNIMGSSKGCIHLVDLLKEGFNAAIQANIRYHIKGLQGQERITRLEELLKDSCLRYTRKEKYKCK